MEHMWVFVCLVYSAVVFFGVFADAQAGVIIIPLVLFRDVIFDSVF